MTAPRLWNHWGVDALGLAACAVVSAVGYACGVGPALRAGQERARLQVELVRLETEADQQVSALRQARQSLDQARRRAEESPVVLRPVEELNQRIGRLTALADANEIRIDQIEPGQPVRASRFTAVPIHLTASGAYFSAGRLLARLHDAYRDMTVSSLKLSGNPADAESRSSLTLDLVWYAAPAAQGDRTVSAAPAGAAARESAQSP